MAEHHSLAQPGRATRIRDRGDIDRGVDRYPRRCLGIAEQLRERRALVGLAEHEHLTTSRLLCCLARHVEARRHRQQHLRAGIGELIAQLARRVERVGGRAATARRNHAMERYRVLGRVRHVDRERVALDESAPSEPRREAAHRPLQLGVAEHADRTGRRSARASRPAPQHAATQRWQGRRRASRPQAVRPNRSCSASSMVASSKRILGPGARRTVVVIA